MCLVRAPALVWPRSVSGRGSDVFAVLAITLGVALQIKSLIDLLALRSLLVVRYERAIRIFVAGLIIVAIGVVAGVFAEVLGHGGMVLRG